MPRANTLFQELASLSLTDRAKLSKIWQTRVCSNSANFCSHGIFFNKKHCKPQTVDTKNVISILERWKLYICDCRSFYKLSYPSMTHNF